MDYKKTIEENPQCQVALSFIINYMVHNYSWPDYLGVFRWCLLQQKTCHTSLLNRNSMFFSLSAC